MTTPNATDILAEIRRIEANISLRESLAERKRVKAQFRKQWETIRALRIHLERWSEQNDEG